jgi:UbiD family decarboxylase
MRDYIERLIARKDMNIVEHEVDPRFELAAVIGRSQQNNDNPVLFREVAILLGPPPEDFLAASP